VVAAFGLVLWRRFITHDEAAGAAITAVAVGLIAGVLMGVGVTGLLVAVVLALTRLRH